MIFHDFPSPFPVNTRFSQGFSIAMRSSRPAKGCGIVGAELPQDLTCEHDGILDQKLTYMDIYIYIHMYIYTYVLYVYIYIYLYVCILYYTLYYIVIR